jgi:RluA family pseudouridine synthase
MGVDSSAALDGRVFVDRKRTTDLQALVSAGAVIRAFPPPRKPALDAPARVLARWSGVVAAYKPAGIPTVPDQRGSSFNLIAALRPAVGDQVTARLQAFSRLDKLVRGVVVLTHGSKALALLTAARERGEYHRHYVAIVAGTLPNETGRVTAAIGRARDPRRRRVGGRSPKAASTRYAVVASTPYASLLAIELDTGRTHQIRVHMQHLGHPLLGDPLYAPSRQVVLDDGTVVPMQRVALHAAWVRLPNGAGEVSQVDAPIPEALTGLWNQLGGSDDDWPRALAPLAHSST